MRTHACMGVRFVYGCAITVYACVRVRASVRASDIAFDALP